MVEPIPNGFSGVKKQNTAVARISAEGFEYLNTNWVHLIASMVPGARVSPDNPAHIEISFELPCTTMGGFPGSGGDLHLCDNGRAGPGSAGFMDQQCTWEDSPCPLVLTIERVQLSPESPDKLAVEADLRIDMVKDPDTREETSLFITSVDNAGLCPFVNRPLGCFANYYSSGRGERDNETLSAKVSFALDRNWDGQLTFDLAPPDPTKPDQFLGGLDAVEVDDIEIRGCKTGDDPPIPCGEVEPVTGSEWCDYACSFLNIGLVKGLIIDSFVKPELQKVVASAIAGQRCRKCNPSDPLVARCPNQGIDSFCDCPDGGSTCEDEARICVSSANRGGACVPQLLGLEQYINLGALLAPFGADPAVKMETFAAAGGGEIAVNTGFQVGMMAGVKSNTVSACVPAWPAPTDTNAPSPNLATEGPSDHHAGLAVSEHFLNYAMWEAHRSGLACITLTTAQAAPLTTGLFKTFLPSLGVVAGSETTDAPMMVVLRPLGAPRIHIGEGTFDPVTKKPIKPLLTAELTDVRIDFYAFIDGRQVRLFTLGADVKVPLSLIIEGSPMTILPALGDLKEMITIRTDVPDNSEILAEDPQALAQLVPMVLGMAEPVIATLLQPVAIPDMNGFRINVKELKGINRIGTSDDFHYLGAFATLGIATQVQSWGPTTVARLVETQVPTKEQMFLEPGRALPWPRATIEVSAEDRPGESRPMEYAWRVNGGLWSTWFDGPTLEVSHPAFILPGKHVIEVRARVAGDAQMIDPTPEALTFLVDWDEPTVAFEADRASNRLLVHARDAVSAPESLRFAYRLGGDELSEFGPAREIDLAAVEAGGGLEVQVMDEAGNVGGARWGFEDLASRPANGPAAQGEGDAVAPATGCSAAGGGLAGLLSLALLPLALRRRQRAERGA
ncbi:MAG: hypothetical protein ACOX6T_24630 [Myxococcales bacterium]